MQYCSAASLETAYGASGATDWDSRLGIPGALPYTELEDAKTTRRTPASRAASRTLSVPSTFTALEVSGSWMDLGTEGIAPWWKTTSTPFTAAATRSYERRSPSISSASSASRLRRCPVEKLSSTRTSSPRAKRARTRFEPMKPAPPVTSVFMGRTNRGLIGLRRNLLEWSVLPSKSNVQRPARGRQREGAAKGA